MNNCALSDIAAVLKSRHNFVVMSHARPDGDAYGRPVGVALDRSGALLVADDVGNVVWRVSAKN